MKKLLLDINIENMYVKASRKLQALARVTPYMDVSKQNF